MAKMDLEIPRFTTPLRAQPPKKRASMEIPLWVRPTCPNNITDYVSVVPSHQAEAAKCLASQREAPHALCKLDSPFAYVEHPTSTAESTDVEDGSDSSTDADEYIIAEDNVEDKYHVSCQCVPSSLACTAPVNKTAELVVALRDARCLAQSRRFALRGEEAYIDPAANLEASLNSTSAEALVTSLRAARLAATARRAEIADQESPAPPCQSPLELEDPFSVLVFDMIGRSHEVGGLKRSMQVCELCEVVGQKLGIIDFAVRLLFDDQVFHMSLQGLTLGKAGISDGCQMTLLKDFGWAKPDVTQLAELEKRWRGKPCE
jgi:hypothetical protein